MECPSRAAPKPRSDATRPCRDSGGGDGDPPGDARNATRRGWIRRRRDRFCVCDVSLRGPRRPGSAHGVNPVVQEYGTSVLQYGTNLYGARRFCQPPRGTLLRPEVVGGEVVKIGVVGGAVLARGCRPVAVRPVAEGGHLAGGSLKAPAVHPGVLLVGTGRPAGGGMAVRLSPGPRGGCAVPVSASPRRPCRCRGPLRAVGALGGVGIRHAGGGWVSAGRARFLPPPFRLESAPPRPGRVSPRPDRSGPRAGRCARGGAARAPFPAHRGRRPAVDDRAAPPLLFRTSARCST